VQQQPTTGGGSEEQRLLQFKNLCFEHSKLGGCSYGADCRFAHEGEPGALRHLIVDGNGDCVQFKKYGNCRRLDRGRCTFKHDPASVQQQSAQQQSAPAQNSTAVMTEEQHKQVMDYAAAAGRDPSAVTFEEVQTAAARAPPARKMSTVLHQDKAVAGRRRPALNAIQWKKWTTTNDESEEEEDYDQ
jgi:hypothetical protein